MDISLCFLSSIYSKYRILIHRVGYIAAVFFAFFTINFIFAIFGFSAIHELKNILISIIVSSTRTLLSICGREVQVNRIGEMFQLFGQRVVLIDAKVLGIRYFAIGSTMLALTNSSVKKVLLSVFYLALAVPLLSIVFLVLRCFDIWWINSLDKFSLFFESTIVLGLLLLMYFQRDYIFENVKDVETSYYNTVRKLDLIYYFNILLFLILIRIVLKYSVFNDLLASLILNLSRWMLHLFDYHPLVFFRNIKGDCAWIEMRNACLGTEVMSVFTTILLLFRGRFFIKIPFLIFGIFIIILINILRIVLLYMYIDQHHGVYFGYLNVHDLYNYPVYIAVVVMWGAYLKWNKKYESKN